mgnify:CR=1 FL=1
MTTPQHYLYLPEQTRELDRIAIEDCGVPGYTLMQRAGAAAYELLRKRWPDARRLAIVCGVGNNAGDGYVIGRLALQDGFHVDLLGLGDPAKLRGDARTAHDDYLAVGGSVLAFDSRQLAKCDVIVDAVFGTGLDREVEGAWAEAVAAINATECPVLAVDIPSGLHGARGTVLGHAVHAEVTATFIGRKAGLYTGAGPEHCGEIVFFDLAVPAEVYTRVAPFARLTGDEVRAPLRRPRPRGAHKGLFGHVLVVGGDHGMGGAVRMAAEAAARVGAGLTSVATRSVHCAGLLSARPELMCHALDSAQDLEPLLARASVVAVGPGLGRSAWARGLLEAVLAFKGPLVVDADALNLLSEAPRRNARWILTPHPGEAARLLGCRAAQVQADRFAAAEALCNRYGGVVILKGAGTIVRSESGAIRVVSGGNPGMASGGMGDTLTGVVAGLLAQGLDSDVAATMGAYLHAAAGDRAAAGQGERGLLASDLLPHLRRLVNP